MKLKFATGRMVLVYIPERAVIHGIDRQPRFRGQAHWFERVLAELKYELWIRDAAKIRSKRVSTRRQTVKIRYSFWIEAGESFSSDLVRDFF